ncbi:MAG TPA: hypothetical protein VF176_04245 [Solirubrobacterales bacterium]
MSRIRIFFLFAALVALATAFAACGDSGGNSNANPQTVIDDATLQGIESGDLDLALGLDAQGPEGGNLDVSLSGPFQSQTSQQFPQLDMTAKASGSIGGDDVDFEGGLVLLSDRAYVNYQGTDYEVDPTTFSFVKSAIQQSQQQNNAQSQVPDVTACQDAVSSLKVGDFIDNLTNDGTADVGGTTTTHVSGDLNVGGAIDAFTGLMDDPACASQLGAAGPLPSQAELNQAKDQVQSALKTAHIDVYVGDDNIVRRISADLQIEPPKGSGGGGVDSVGITFDLTIDGVNEEQTIEVPDEAKPLNDLFMKLGVNPISLLNATQGGAGVGGLGDLLGGLGDSNSHGGSGSGSAGGSQAGGQQAYLDCLKGASTPADLQSCAELLR